MLWVFGLFVGVMGCLLAVQPLLNAKVGLAAGHPIHGALVSVVVSTLTLTVTMVLLRAPLPDLRAVSAHPPWTWAGGVIGAFVVLAALLATPRLGAATTVMLFIVGQMAASLILDHFGLLGVPVHAIDLSRLLGVLCLIAGVVLIRFV